MKKITLIMLFFTVLTYGQNPFVCGTVFDPQIQNQNSNVSTLSPIDPNHQYVINIFFHIINETDGTNNVGISFGEAKVMDGVKALNVAYNQYNIFFKYKGFQIINNSTMTNSGGSYPGTAKADCFNLYFVNYLPGGSAGSVQGNTKSIFSFAAIASPYYDFTLVHEIGHCMNLLHTFQSGTNGHLCEHVTRDENAPNYNANEAGDKVADTPAQPQVGGNEFFECDWIYNPARVDCEGTPYENIARGNYMGYDTGDENGQSPCFHFTPGQIERIKNYLNAPGFDHYYLSFNTVESLYQPFEVQNMAGDHIVSVTPLPDGQSAEVCRNLLVKHRFQKGFDYEFYNVGANDPVSGTIDDIPTIKDATYNFDVKINQVNTSNAETVELDCTRGVLCNTETLRGGRIVSTKVLGSMNITVKELDEIEVKDPLLYEKLMAEYYHLIEKETESGAKFHETIYKY